MATSKDVRKLTDVEQKLIVSALELQAKSFERAQRANANDDVLSGAYSHKAAQCSNLITLIRNGALEF